MLSIVSDRMCTSLLLKSSASLGQYFFNPSASWALDNACPLSGNPY